ncbi:MAG TPA: aromatic ring-hydroxylating dioxygenase subunit alpha [Allosphingosinicella sp.]
MRPWPAAVAAGWHPVAFSERVTSRRPVAGRLMGRRLAIARDGSGAFVLEDRCPHRGAPLSRGRMSGGGIACPYHGWTFGRGGKCLSVPGSDELGAAARALPSVERAGLVWTSLAASPGPFPQLPAAMEAPELDRFWWPLPASRAGLLDAVENHLDPAHPHHVHPWMVRSPSRRRPVEVVVRSGAWGAEAVYHERSRPTGLMPRLLEGRRALSIGRLYPPTIAEVAFEGACGLSLSVAVVFGPEDHGLTRPWAHFATPRGRAPAWAKRWILKAFHRPVLSQDRQILALQEEWRGDDPPAYATGPLDVIGPTLWRLANGLPEPERERTIQMAL